MSERVAGIPASAREVKWPRKSGVLVIGGLLVLAPVGCKRPEVAVQPAPPVRIQAAEVALAPNSLRYSATIQPTTQINLSFKVGGYLGEIF